MVPVLKINPAQPEDALLEKARKTLTAGGLVIVPTETVYGIACDPAAPGAMERLLAAKGRDGDKPVARLAADAEQVQSSAKNWSAGMAALAAAFWPGPLTLVIETHDGWTGYRVPDHPVALRLAECCGRSLALTSANLSGDPDTKTAAEAMAAVEADLVLDSGPSATEAIPSTVVKVDGENIACLREGCLPFREVEAIFKKCTPHLKRILFVCTGNTCRSPMAAALFAHRMGSDSGWEAVSAGIYAGFGSPASHHAVEALKELSIELTHHQSKPLTAELVETADLIVTMTASHRLAILQDFPAVGNKVCLIKSFGTSKVPADIPDPFGGSLDVYKKTRDEIDRALSDLILFIRTGKPLKK